MVNNKIIHFCWFGMGKMPDEVSKTVNNWKKILHDYEFMLWDESTFNVNMHPYTKEAYNHKKYAYVTDYVRLYVLKLYGGIYMDTDVDVIKSLDIFLENRAFTGCESDQMCVTGIMGAVPNHPWINDLISHYDNLHFENNGELSLIPNTKFITEVTIQKYGWKQKNIYQELQHGLVIYPFNVLCAKNWETGKIEISDDTYTIHNFSGSWLSKRQKSTKKVKSFIKNLLKKIVGENNYKKIINKKRKMDL